MPFRFGLWEIIILLPVLVVYFIPIIVAAMRQTINLAGIIILNLLTGWTFEGWIASLVRAITASKESQS